MTAVEQALLDLVRAALTEATAQDPALSGPEWTQLLRLAETQKLMPLVLDAACSLPSYRSAAHPMPAPGRPPTEAPPSPPTLEDKPWKQMVLEQVNAQVYQENDLLNLLLALRRRGLEPMVVKGAVCRNLYPKPLLRPSVDEDLYYPGDLTALHQALLDLGLTPDNPDLDPAAAPELSYHRLGSPTYLEVHRALLPPDSPVFNPCNRFFEGVSAAAVPIQDVEVPTLPPTEHLLFLVLHAYKHFLHSGFGLRLISDLALFSRAYGEQIDYPRVLEACRALRCDCFAAAMYRIADRHLGLPVPEAFAELETDELPMLEDILSAGIHGNVDLNRLHSSSITLRTVEAGSTGGSGTGLRKALFPSARAIRHRYPYLEKRPWLLPVAWVQRFWRYGRGVAGRESAELNPTASVRLGQARVELLRKYGIID